MHPKAYYLISGTLFAAVAVAHLVRLVAHWQIQVNGTDVPLWVSWLGLAVPGALAVWAFALAGRHGHDT
jgi:hypothetical protein